MARYVVHYQDGSVALIDVLCFRDINDWNGYSTNTFLTRTTSASIAWSGSSKAEHTPRLYHFTWRNPHPEKVIESIDFERGPLDKPAPLCMAITCGDAMPTGPETGVLWAKVEENCKIKLEGPRSLELTGQQSFVSAPIGEYEATVLQGSDAIRTGGVTVGRGNVTWMDASSPIVRVRQPSPTPAQRFLVQIKCIRSLAISRDHQVLVCTAGDGSVALYRRGTNGYSHITTSHTLSLSFDTFAAIGPEGNVLVTGDDSGKVCLWDSETLELLETLRDDPKSRVRSLAISPNGKMLAIGDARGRVELWDLDSKVKLGEIPAHAREVGALTFSPDGKLLATGELQWLPKKDNEWVDTENTEESYLKVWNVTTREPVFELRGHWGSVNSIAFSPDGQVLASASQDSSIRLWNMADGKQLRVLFGFDALNDVAFSPDGSKIAAACNQGVVQVWETQTARLLYDFAAHWNNTIQIAFTGDGSLVTGGGDNATCMWNLASLPHAAEAEDASPQPVEVIRFASCKGVSVTASGNEMLLAAIDFGGGNGSVWDRTTHRQIARFYPKYPMGEGSILLGNIAFLPEGNLLARSSNPTCIRQYDEAFGKNDLLRGEGYGNMAVSPDGHRLVATDCDKKRVDLIELDYGTIRKGPSFPALGGPWQPAFRADGERIAVPTDKGYVALIDTKTLETVGKISHDDNAARICRFSPKSGLLLVAGESVKLWDAENMELIAELRGPEQSVYAMAFSPDGRFAVTGGGAGPWTKKAWDFHGEICIWDCESHELVRKFSAHQFGVENTAFTSDGKSLFTTGWDGKVCQWDFATLVSDAGTEVAAKP